MPRYLDETIRAENAVSVFKAVAENKCDTRADIATFAGLSIVTANKATEAFLNKGIFIQKDIRSKSIGRHASHIFLDQSKILTLIDISDKNFEAKYYNLSLEQVGGYKYCYIEDFTYKDNLRTFFHRIKAHMIDNSDKRYLMVGMIVSGTYDRENDKITNVDSYDIENLNIGKFIQSSVAMSVNMTIGRMSSAVRHCQAICAANENVLYINVDTVCQKIQTRLVLGGKLLRNFGEAYKILNLENMERQISDIIQSVCMISNISRVYLDCNEIIKADKLEAIKQSLEDREAFVTNRVPELIRCEPNVFAHNGCIDTLRKIWLDRVVKF